MLFNVNVVETEQISVGWNNVTHSDKFIYQFAQLVLEFIDFFFMCKFGAPEDKFITMLIIFYFSIFCYSALCCFFLI